MAGDASRRNGKLGGRKPGQRTAAVLEREAVLRAYRQRVCAHADELLNAQLTVALGAARLFRKLKKDGKVTMQQVTDPAVVAQYLDGSLDWAGDAYYIVMSDPDPVAIDKLLDRTFDRPAQRQYVEVSGADGQPVPLRIVHEYPAAPTPPPGKE